MTKSILHAAAALSLALLALAGPGGIVLAAPAAANVPVAAADFSFQPQSVTVSVGDTVVWTNSGATAHTVTASDGSWDSGNLAPGATFSHTFSTAGTFAYYCAYHGSAQGAGMAGTVIVQAAAGAVPAAPASTAAPAATAAPEVTAAAAPTEAPTAAAAPTVAAPTAAPAATATAAPASGPTPSIDVSDQPIENDSITIAKVVAAQDGWIVVHTNTADNKPGPVIGHVAVSAGENDNVVVPLDQTPAEGDKLWPMLHIDAGQIGVYEFPGADSPVIVNGNIVMEQITVQPSAGAAAAQPTAPASAAAPAPTALPSGAAQPTAQPSMGAAPRALPNTGEAPSSGLWLGIAGIALLLLAGGALVLRNGAPSRRD